MYDPYGDYSYANGGGNGDVLTGAAANIVKFKEFHKSKNNQEVEMICKETKQEEEEVIIQKAWSQPTAGAGDCSRFSSTVLSGQPSFPKVRPDTFWLGDLWNQIESGP